MIRDQVRILYLLFLWPTSTTQINQKANLFKKFGPSKKHSEQVM